MSVTRARAVWQNKIAKGSEDTASPALAKILPHMLHRRAGKVLWQILQDQAGRTRRYNLPTTHNRYQWNQSGYKRDVSLLRVPNMTNPRPTVLVQGLSALPSADVTFRKLSRACQQKNADLGQPCSQRFICDMATKPGADSIHRSHALHPGANVCRTVTWGENLSAGISLISCRCCMLLNQSRDT